MDEILLINNDMSAQIAPITAPDIILSKEVSYPNILLHKNNNHMFIRTLMIK